MSGGLVQFFDRSRLLHLKAWLRVHFDPATGSNPSVLDGVEGDTRQIRSPASCALK